MTTQELKNRGDNLLPIGVAALAGVAFIPEIFMEGGAARIDDILLLLIGLVGLIWYFAGEDRYQKSIVPFVIVGLSFIVKLYSTYMEAGSPLGRLDDVAGLILFILASAIALWTYTTHSSVDDRITSIRAH